MKKIFAIAALALTAVSAAAQETYENAKISWSDLNGTARYVGMGGALEALGADISTIGTNPAGIGLFRKSNVSLSIGAVSQQDAKSFGGGNTTNISFDQIGFVYSGRNNSSSFINFAFNYHKSRNFNYILSAADGLYNASQNKQTYLKAKGGWLYANALNPNFNSPYIQCNQLDALYSEYLLYDPDADYAWGYYEANGYTMDRRHWGYVADYDFNLSGNINDRVYLGMTVGVHDVHYNHMSEYVETFDTGSPIMVRDERKIKGAGADIKAGVIFRPIEYSPFRIGLSVTTPTWYDLTTSNITYMSDDGGSVHSGDEYEFKLFTPWKFGLSMGTTIGDYLALGASYEYTDYGSLDTRYKTGEHYNYWVDDYTYESESDEEMNRHTGETLKGVSTLKLGAEFKAAPEVAVRFGYNYVSPMYDKDGYKDGTLPCEGSYYSSATDWTNWEAIHRITCGVGIQIDNVNLSAAYQYSTQNGWFSPFNSFSSSPSAADYDPTDDYDVYAVKLSNKRHQFLLTATINL